MILGDAQSSKMKSSPSVTRGDESHSRGAVKLPLKITTRVEVSIECLLTRSAYLLGMSNRKGLLECKMR